MDEQLPIHDLRHKLEAERLRAVEAFAARPEPLDANSADALSWIALVNNVLAAVRDELDAHQAKVGWGKSAP